MTNKERYDYLKAHDRCVTCGKQDAYTLIGKVRCYECGQKVNNYCKEYAKNNDRYLTEKHRREERIKNHKCARCGVELEKDSKYKKCDKCRAKDLNSWRKYHLYSLRGEDGMCYMCHQSPAIAGKSLCNECYEKAKASIANARQYRKQQYFAKLNYLHFKECGRYER